MTYTKKLTNKINSRSVTDEKTIYTGHFKNVVSALIPNEPTIYIRLSLFYTKSIISLIVILIKIRTVLRNGDF